jgi:hypothetical protein
MPEGGGVNGFVDVIGDDGLQRDLMSLDTLRQGERRLLGAGSPRGAIYAKSHSTNQPDGLGVPDVEVAENPFVSYFECLQVCRVCLHALIDRVSGWLG